VSAELNLGLAIVMVLQKNKAMTVDLESIDWAVFKTAYGTATFVPKLIVQLAGNNHEIAMGASHELWCALCHQHAYVSSAALPSLPFILKVLDGANDALSVEILDILLGFAVCETDGTENAPWLEQLRAEVTREHRRFRALSSSQNETVAYFAVAILEKIGEKNLEMLQLL